MSFASLRARLYMEKVKLMFGGRRRAGGATVTSSTGTGLGMHHAHGRTSAGARPGCFGFGRRRTTGYY
ncbi:hypothetical protein WJX79_006446 [Trebouxia sp. C0005]